MIQRLVGPLFFGTGPLAREGSAGGSCFYNTLADLILCFSTVNRFPYVDH